MAIALVPLVPVRLIWLLERFSGLVSEVEIESRCQSWCPLDPRFPLRAPIRLSGRSWLVAQGRVRDEKTLESLPNRDRREPSNAGEEESEAGRLPPDASTGGREKQT